MRKELKKARKCAGLTQAELAEQIGCSRENYAGIESGRLSGSVKLWVSIQRALSLSPEDLLIIITEGEC